MRALPEAPHPYRTCFERDRDRIVHSAAFRRLAGKTQVFLFPADHQRTRLTHALEVAQVAGAIARACRANEALTEAIALGHDCGHGPGGHASEAVFSRFLPEGFEHAPWGADVVLGDLNLCSETLDGIRNHSWSRPTPATPEGEIVSWADRIAYVCHDYDDALGASIVGPADLPEAVAAQCGTRPSDQIEAFVTAMVEATAAAGRVAMAAEFAEALSAFRSFNHEAIYQRPASVRQNHLVDEMLSALTAWLIDHPAAIPQNIAADREPERRAVTWVAGMTDRFACRLAVRHLGWPLDQMPRGFDVFG